MISIMFLSAKQKDGWQCQLKEACEEDGDESQEEKRMEWQEDGHGVENGGILKSQEQIL